jgi:SAM-dependent methyltransferase
MTDQFNYESKVWGAHEVGISPRYLGALRLHYCLEDLDKVQGRVLEIGCGGGAMVRAIKEYRPDLEVHGCDISLSAIQVARRRNGGILYSAGDAYRLPYPDDYFSAIFIFDVLEHLEEPNRAMGAIFQILKTGGLFHLYTPVEGSLLTLHGLASRMGWRAKEHYGGHIQRFTMPDLQELIEEKGFVIRTERWSSHLFNQVIDVAFFTALSVRGKNIPTSVESYLDETGNGFFPTFVRIAKTLVAALSYYESKLLWKLPGSGVHLSCYKGETKDE